MNILIICGESSSNLLGFKLAQRLLDEGHSVYSFGNHQLAEVSHQLLSLDTTQHSVALGQWQKKYRLIRRMTAAIQQSPITFEKAIIIDFPSYNFKIASMLQHFNIPIITFITPNFWIWKNRRLAKKILQYSDDVITIFKPEYHLYSTLNPEKTHYFGHPLSLETKQKSTSNLNAFTIGIFPGSRFGEVHHHLPIMLTIIQHLSSLNFVIFCEQSALHDTIQQYLDQYQLPDLKIETQLDLSIDYAITAPGTNSLKLALHRIPLTIIGYLNQFVFLIAKYILRLNVPFIGLPNIILNQPVFPEYIQPKLSKSKEICDEILEFIESKDGKQNYVTAFDQLEQITTAPNDYYQKITALLLK